MQVACKKFKVANSSKTCCSKRSSPNWYMSSSRKVIREAAAICRELQLQQARDRLQLFPFYSLQYLDVGEVTLQCPHCGTVCMSMERITKCTEQPPEFSNCRWRGGYSLHFLSDPPLLLHQLLTGPTTVDRWFVQNVREYIVQCPWEQSLSYGRNEGPFLRLLIQLLLCKGKHTSMLVLQCPLFFLEPYLYPFIPLIVTSVLRHISILGECYC